MRKKYVYIAAAVWCGFCLIVAAWLTVSLHDCTSVPFLQDKVICSDGTIHDSLSMLYGQWFVNAIMGTALILVGTAFFTWLGRQMTRGQSPAHSSDWSSVAATPRPSAWSELDAVSTVPVIAATDRQGAGEVAPFWRRFVAVSVDRLIMLALLLALVWLGQGMTERTYDVATAHMVTRVTFVGGFIMLLGFLSAPEYFIVCETLLRARSVGYRLLGIRLVRQDGKPLNLGVHTIRWCGQFASLAAAGVGYFHVLRSKNKQTWHDVMAGTVVVRG